MDCPRFFKSLYVLILFVWSIQYFEAQNQQIELKLSNDKFVFQDKYYTSGLHIIYRRRLENGFIFKKQEHQNLQLNITLGNETYTPSNLSSFDVNDFDRPYAGWLFLGAELAKIKPKAALFLTIESGVTGKESLAGKFQNAFHDLLNIERPTWQDEIAYKWLFNFKIRQVFEFPLAEMASLQNHTGLSVGSKDTYFKNSLFLFLGKFNKLQNSSRINTLGLVSKKEFFGFIGGGYKYVALNTLIQGSPFNENDVFTSIGEKHIYSFQTGSTVRTIRNFFKLEFTYNSKETPLSKSHIFGAFTFGYFF